jgi:SAM-dependent methyltransferase
VSRFPVIPETTPGTAPEATSPASYDAAFFRALEDGVDRSAALGAALLVERFSPRSVVDIGCGTGIWLAALRDRGVEDVFGVDGPWVPREQLAIPEALFRTHDLIEPLDLGRRFDLALSLETAEHLPEAVAPRFVETLVRLAPVIVFSAAVPGQGGHHHVNERWPSYWIELFARHGYRASTALRERLWRSEAVEVWYRQNMLCFADLEHAGRLDSLFGADTPAPLDIVHPDLFLRVRGDLDHHQGYAARLERDLKAAKTETQSVRRELRNVESTLKSTENNLRRTRDELWWIKNSRAYRFYQQLRTAPTLPKRALRRLWPKGPDR